MKKHSSQSLLAQRVSAALHAEGADNFVLYSPERVDYPIYAHWSPILNRRAWTPSAGPWVNHPRSVTYHRDLCPRSLDLLSRAIHLDISPELTSSQLEELTEAIHKVLSGVV